MMQLTRGQLNGWYYVVPKKGMPFIQERVKATVEENRDKILAAGEYVEYICDVGEILYDKDEFGLYSPNKLKLTTPFSVELHGDVIYTLKNELMIAKVTQIMLTQ